MEKGNRHPDRAEMLAAIKLGTVPFADHLKSCESCRQLFEILSQFGEWEVGKDTGDPGREAGDIRFEAPLDSVYRHRAIARLIQSRRPERTIDGKVAFDSWADLPAVEVREAALEGERRLRLTADRYTLELIGDRRLDRWEFVARVYDRKKVSSEFILQIGRKKLHPCSQACFFWDAKRPPRRIQLLSPSLKIDFGEVRW